MNILKYYKSKHHPEMEPFPVLKQVWGERESQILGDIKYQEDRQYRMSGQQADETYRAYPETTNGIPQDEWPEELQEIWEYWDDEMAKIDKTIDGLYGELIELEKNQYCDLDPKEIMAMETEVRLYCPPLTNEKWGMAKLMESLEYKYLFFEYKGKTRKRDLPAELVRVEFAGDERMIREVERIANMGIKWIEEQERLLLGLNTNE